MKFNYINENDFKLFISKDYIKEIDYEEKAELMAFLKIIIVKIKNIYGIVLSGFYEVEINILNNIGLELLFKKCDNYTFSNKVIDLKMTINLSPSVYLKFDNYDYISNYNNIRFNNNLFYLDSSYLLEEDIIKLSDFYSVVIDEDDIIDKYLLIKA